jgi:hypothetical protein
METADDNMMTEETENKREYSRVDTCIPLEYNLVRHEHKETMRARVAGQSVLAEFKNLPNPDDQLIAQWLQSINTKLNEIIRLITLHHDGFNCLNMAKVNISGGGMSLNTGKSFAIGDVLEIKAMLGIQMPVALFLYAEVIDTGISHPEYDTSVEFINMDDFIRDEIIRFVFETEREILREKRR